MSKTILVTGGTGFLGTHICTKLISNDYKVIVLDNLNNSVKDSLLGVEKITGIRPTFIQGDVRELSIVAMTLHTHPIDAVIHLASTKDTPIANNNPLLCYDINIAGTINLLQCMNDANIRKIVYASSTTVYGDTNIEEINEETPTNPMTVGATSKLMCETCLHDLAKTGNIWNVSILRTSPIIGAHFSGNIGEHYTKTEETLSHYISGMIKGIYQPSLQIKNRLQNYIHVMDVASAYVLAIDNLFKQKSTNIEVFNIGPHNPVSIADLVSTFYKVANCKEASYRFSEIDFQIPLINIKKADNLLHWNPIQGVSEMCKDELAWRYNYPIGY